jgi:hypothetical protein
VITPARASDLPRLAPPAYQGIAGEVVGKLAPVTEADPVALLVTLLAAAGAAIGDGPHVLIGGSAHPARIWPLIIGRTGSGRKGESWAQTERILTAIEPSFVRENITTGLSTGEGLIAAFRDHEDAEGKIKSRDKRLLIVEAEFGRTLGVTRREGNTLSAVLRTLWESGRAAVLTKSEPLRCRDAHLVVVAHITPGELLLKLSEADVSGGLVNRFVPVLAGRPHLLADDADMPDLNAIELKRRISAARKHGRLRRNAEAAVLWKSAYEAMSEDEEDGPLGEILARGPAYSMRLALIYALLDGASEIGVTHLRSGLAVWDYVAATSRRVFAQRSGRNDLDRLADYLADGHGGRTRTEIRNLFGRNRSAESIDGLVAELERRGDAQQEEDRSGRGRPVVRTYWTGTARTSLSSLLQEDAINAETLNAGQDGGLNA